MTADVHASTNSLAAWTAAHEGGPLRSVCAPEPGIAKAVTTASADTRRIVEDSRDRFTPTGFIWASLSLRTCRTSGASRRQAARWTPLRCTNAARGAGSPAERCRRCLEWLHRVSETGAAWCRG